MHYWLNGNHEFHFIVFGCFHCSLLTIVLCRSGVVELVSASPSQWLQCCTTITGNIIVFMRSQSSEQGEDAVVDRVARMKLGVVEEAGEGGVQR